jgi:hypothetical protein
LELNNNGGARSRICNPILGKKGAFYMSFKKLVVFNLEYSSLEEPGLAPKTPI